MRYEELVTNSFVLQNLFLSERKTERIVTLGWSEKHEDCEINKAKLSTWGISISVSS